MLTNDQMKRYRYQRWADARRLVSRIQATLNAGGIVMMATYTQARQYDKKSHADMFKATRTGAYVQQGKKWVCIDGCGFTFYTPKVK